MSNVILFNPQDIPSRRRHYETIFILSPTLNETDVQEVIKKNVATLEQYKTDILRQDDWAKKRLAHIIDKHQIGRYFYFRYIGTSEAVREFERNLKLDARVVRYQSVALSNHPLSSEEIAVLVERAPREQSSAPSVRQEEEDLEAGSYS